MKELDNKVIGERLNRICEALRLNLPELAIRIGVPYPTLYKNSRGSTQASSRFYVGLFELGVNLHWLVSGKGDMFRASTGAEEAAASYSYQGNTVAVHNNHGSVKAGLQASEAVGRGSQICGWIIEYMRENDPDQQAWLDIEMQRHFPEYAAFVKDKKHSDA